MIPEDRKCLLALRPNVPRGYTEHELGLHPCAGTSSGKVQICLYDKDEDFPEAFITLDRKQQRRLAEALLAFLEEGGAK